MRVGSKQRVDRKGGLLTKPRLAANDIHTSWHISTSKSFKTFPDDATYGPVCGFHIYSTQSREDAEEDG